MTYSWVENFRPSLFLTVCVIGCYTPIFWTLFREWTLREQMGGVDIGSHYRVHDILHVRPRNVTLTSAKKEKKCHQ